MRKIAYAAASLALAACAATSPTSDSGRGYLAVSANDNKAVLVDGKTTFVPNAAPDTRANEFSRPLTGSRCRSRAKVTSAIATIPAPTRRGIYFPVQTVPALFSIGTPTAFPYSVQDPS